MREFEPPARSIRNWVTAADLAEGQRTEELNRLRRENRRFQQEREFLARAERAETYCVRIIVRLRYL